MKTLELAGIPYLVQHFARTTWELFRTRDFYQYAYQPTPDVRRIIESLPNFPNLIGVFQTTSDLEVFYQDPTVALVLRQNNESGVRYGSRHQGYGHQQEFHINVPRIFDVTDQYHRLAKLNLLLAP